MKKLTREQAILVMATCVAVLISGFFVLGIWIILKGRTGTDMTRQIISMIMDLTILSLVSSLTIEWYLRPIYDDLVEFKKIAFGLSILYLTVSGFLKGWAYHEKYFDVYVDFGMFLAGLVYGALNLGCLFFIGYSLGYHLFKKVAMLSDSRCGFFVPLHPLSNRTHEL